MTTEQAAVYLAPEDRVALITGASRGIGLATARSLAQRGFRIVITGREESDLARAVADLRALHPGVSAFAGDCADPAVVNALIHAIQRDFGRLDVVVNNSGGSHHGRPLETVSDEDWERTLGQNLMALHESAARLCRC